MGARKTRRSKSSFASRRKPANSLTAASNVGAALIAVAVLGLGRHFLQTGPAAEVSAPDVQSLFAEANAAYRRGELASAKELYESVVAAHGGRAGADAGLLASAYSNMGSLVLDSGDGAGALELYRKAVQADPGHADALFNLGVLLQDAGNLAEAEAAYRRALSSAGAGDLGGIYANLATTLHAREPPLLEEAIEMYSEAIDATISHAPDNAADAATLSQLHFLLGRALLDLPEGTACSALRGGGAGAPCAALAAEALEKALRYDAGHSAAEHMLAALRAEEGGGAVRDAASATFVEAVFDDYAATFDAHLRGLRYQAPVLLAGALGGGAFEAVLDLGSGTGLMGGLLRNASLLARRDGPGEPGGLLWGLDISRGMLQQALGAQARLRGEGPEGRASPAYDLLVHGELVDALSRWAGAPPGPPGSYPQDLVPVPIVDAAAQPHAPRFDLITAADVFVYVGELAAVFALAAALLRPGGRFAFTVERLEGDRGGEKGWDLQASGRYAHTPDYVAATAEASGLVVDLLEDAVPRYERGEPVKGLLAVLSRPDGAGAAAAP